MLKATLLLTAGLFCICALGRAEEIGLPHVSVFGTATTEVRPDRMHWFLTVRNKAAALQDASNEHARAVQQVLELLKAQKLPETNIQTARMEFGENREYKNNSWVQEGYFASTDITFKLDDFEQYKALWMGLSGIPNVSVRTVQYDHSRRIEYQNDTRTKAVVAARDKARALAGALDSTIAEPLLIEEDLAGNEGWDREALLNNVRNVSFYEGNGGTRDEQLAPGTIPIRVRVKVAFRLISHNR